MTEPKHLKDAYSLILEAIDVGVYKPGDRLVESELADRFWGCRETPIREALAAAGKRKILADARRALGFIRGVAGP